MKTIQLTNTEYALVKQAVVMFNDMTNDTVFDDIPELFHSEEPSVINNNRRRELRDELNDALNRVVHLREIARKFGVAVNADGYVSG